MNKYLMVLAALCLTMAATAAVTTHLKLDCRTGVRVPSPEGEILRYDASWCENGDEVRITENGNVVATGTAGCYTWFPSPSCSAMRLLKLDILCDGQVVGSETAQFRAEKTVIAISNFVVSAITPWDKAILSFDVGGAIPSDAMNCWLEVVVSNCTTHAVISAGSVSGATNLMSGAHTVVWDWVNDVPFFQGSDVSVRCVYHYLDDAEPVCASAWGEAKLICDSASPCLVHRWSFNGDLTDSVGGQPATIVGNVTTDGRVYKTPGGVSGSAYIDLGDWILPTNGSPITIELWATLWEPVGGLSPGWQRIFEFGSMPAGYRFSSGSTSCYSCDSINMCRNGSCGGGSSASFGSFSPGVEYHLAAVWEMGADGIWRATNYRQRAATGATVEMCKSTLDSAHWPGMKQTEMLLAQALTCWDFASKADYNEVRIWNRALTEDEFTQNVLDGPDALIVSVPTFPIDIRYSPVGTNIVQVLIDGNVILTDDKSGAFAWDPDESGSHEVEIHSGALELSCTIDVPNEYVCETRGHVEVETVAAKEPTCTEAGCTRGAKCSRCNVVLTSSTLRTALGHTEVVTTVAKAATCTEAGCTQGAKCSRCNMILANSEILPALGGHIEVESVAAKEPTCTEAGCTQGTKCSRCNAVLTASEIRSALGHLEVETVAAKEPTCTETGCTHEMKCSRCETMLTTSQNVPALGHSESVVKEAVEPTHYHDGCTAEIVCTRCESVLQSSAVLPRLTAAGIENLSVETISPWGKIVARYEVCGEMPEEANSYRAYVIVKDADSGTIACLRHVWGDRSLTVGWHNIVADVATAKPGFRSTNCVVSVIYRKPMYYAVDLTADGSESRPVVMDLCDIPAGGWTDEYKTTKLVLRRIESGSYIMGEDQHDESHRVTISKPFCAGVFEITQRQWTLIMGLNPSYFYSWDTRPVESVSYDMIRGESAGSEWPNSSAVDDDSFLGRLRARTGLECDLPTEAQWEYACRAGTTTAYNNGTASDIGSVGRYYGNGGYPHVWTDGPSKGSAKVGSYQPNAWGLYDMHGNVSEWCLDWHGAEVFGFDPVGQATGTRRCLRGGSYEDDSYFCRSYSRGGYAGSAEPCFQYQSHGFRLALSAPDDASTGICAGLLLSSLPTGEETLCSKSVHPVSVFAALAEEGFASPVEIEYAPFAPNGRVDVCVDGGLLLSADENGRFAWQPDALGVHELVHRSIGVEWSLTIDVTNLDCRVTQSPNPPMPIVDDIVIPPFKEFASANRSANTFSVSATNGTETWTASVSDEWITLTRTTGGVDVNKVVYSVAANPSAGPRTGFVYVCGHVHTIVQPGTGAEISPSGMLADYQGLTQRVEIAVSVDDAEWDARPGAPWISVQPTNGRGESNLTVQVAPYYQVGMRNADVIIAGRELRVEQRGRDMELSFGETNITSQAQSVAFDILAIEDVNWNLWDLLTECDWVSVAESANGTGSARVCLDISENESYLPRFATIGVWYSSPVDNGKEWIVIEQDGTRDLEFALDEPGADVVAQSGINEFHVLATPDLPWTASSDCRWIALENAAGSGTGELKYTVTGNPGLTPRVGHITVVPQVNSEVSTCSFEVRQSAAVANLSCASVDVSAAEITMPVAVSVDSIVVWPIENNCNWVRIEGGLSRTGPQTVYVQILENTALDSREGVVRIAGHDFVIHQTGGVLSLSQSQADVPANGGDITVAVSCSSNLNWEICEEVEWVSVANGTSRKGPTSVILHVAANASVHARRCQLVIGGREFVICQSSADASVDADLLVHGADAEVGSVEVTAPNYLTWAATTTNDWIYLMSEESTSGAGTVEYIVDELDAASSRIGIIWAGKTPVYICQSGFEISLDADSKTVSRVSGNGQIAVTVDDAADEWCAISTVPWITVQTPSGTGDGIVQYSYEDNTTGVARVGRILVCDQVFTVTQTDGDPDVPRWQISYENLHGAAHTNPNHYDEGDVVAFVAPTGGRTGYAFAGWEPSGIATDDTGDKTVRAIWTANAYEVVFDANGGTGSMPNQAFVYGEAKALSVNAFVRNGYAFTGWSTHAGVGSADWSDGAGVSNLTTIAGDEVRLYAQWAAVPYAISYMDTKDQANANPSTYTVEDKVTFAALGDMANFTFAGWTPSSIAAGSTGDRIVTANWNWTPSDAVVAGEITGGKPVNIKSDWAKTSLTQRFGAGKDRVFREKFGANLLTALTKPTGKHDGEGNELAVWHDYVAGTDPTDTNSVFKAKVTMKGGMPVIEWDPNLNSNGEERVYTIYGKNTLGDAWHSPTNANDHFFKVDVAMPPEGTVAFNLGGATGSVDPVSVRVGQPVGDLPTPTRSGYQFLGWFTLAEGGELVTPETIVAADMTIYAHWKARLVHRWSFNGNLNDSIGGQTATIVGNVTTDGTSYKTPGGSSGSAYIDLGNWILPTNGSPVTVEMWVTQDASVNFGRVFCWGGMPTEGKFSGYGGNRNAPEWLQLRWDGTCEAGSLGSFGVGTEYYVAMILEPTTDGAWKATYYKKSASTGETLSSVSSELKQGWTIQGFQQTDMVLGQTLTTWDPCSMNSYNELRIWIKAMTEAELTASVLAGPDAEL